MHKVKEHEAYLVLFDVIRKNFTILHVIVYQDDLKYYVNLIIPERLNIEADKITTSKVNPPLNTPLPSGPFAIHVKEEYIHINFQTIIR